MPNGRNAGRLFPDCTNEHGFGEYHVIPLPDESHGGAVQCRSCGRWFVQTEDGLEELAESPIEPKGNK